MAPQTDYGAANYVIKSDDKNLPTRQADLVLRNYSSSIDAFAYASCSFGNQFDYDVEPHFSYQTKPNEEWYVGLQANSPS